MHQDLQTVINNFQVEGEFLTAEVIPTGHINDTYASVFQTPNGSKRYIHQRINTHVFRQPEQMMENIARVTRVARRQILAAGGDPQRETLNLVLTREGGNYYRTPGGDYWRTYHFIEGAHTYDKPVDSRQLSVAACAFGKFQRLLSTIPGEQLYETIPDFHHTLRRYQAFEQAIQHDLSQRSSSVQLEINYLLGRQSLAGVIVELLAQGLIPNRVVHNDTKLNNVLFDDQTGEGICIIDLDTVMPGSVLFDFGDMVRTGASTAVEDDPELTRVHFDPVAFYQIASGYLDATVDFLTPLELDYLAFSARLITYEQALRFLGDYLNGDVYYKIHRPQHNLDRARNQIQFLHEMEVHFNQMQDTIGRLANDRLA